jgi:predicted nucleic acid-binding protein
MSSIDETTPFIIDTNILVLAVTNNTQQDAALNILKQANAHITSKSLLELVAVLSKPAFDFSKAEIFNVTEHLQTIFLHKVLVEKQDTYNTTLQLFQASNKTKKWFIFDCQLAATALNHNISTIFTQNKNDFDWLPVVRIKSLG